MTVLEQSSFGSSPSKKIVWQSTNLTATATICERRHHTLLSQNSNNYFFGAPITPYNYSRPHYTV